MTSLGQTAGSIRSRGVAAAASGSATEINDNKQHNISSYGRSTPPNRASSLSYPRKLFKPQEARHNSTVHHLQGSAAVGVNRVEVRLLVLVTGIAFLVRMYKIGQPSSVV